MLQLKSIFELEKCTFFKWVRISPEIDWNHYQGASPAPKCIVRYQTLIKTPMRLSVTSEPSVGVWGGGKENMIVSVLPVCED